MRAVLTLATVLATLPAARPARAAWPDSYPGRVALVRALRLDMAWPDMMPDAEAAARRYREACEMKSASACLYRKWLPEGAARGDLVAAAAALAPRCPRDPLACVVVGWAAVLDEHGHLRPDAPGAARAAASFRTACDQAYAAGCTALGELTAVGLGVPRNEERARELLDEGCRARDPWGCARLAELEPDATRSRELLEEACEAGVPHACVELGARLEDPARSVALYERACRDRYAGGCRALGRAYALGRGVARSPAVALGLFRTACEAGDPDACFEMADLLAAGGAGDPAEAAGVFSAACERGVARACARLAEMMLEGRGVERDEERANALLDEACRQGAGSACDRIGLMYETGRGQPMNLTRAVKSYQRGCNLEDAGACWHLAALYRIGKGVDENRARALGLVRRACDLGGAQACHELADRTLRGNGVHRDPARAAELFGRACDGGVGDACATLGQMLAEGEGVAADPAAAARRFRRACELESGAGCYGLGRLLERGLGGAAPDHRAALARYRAACALGYEKGCGAAGAVTFAARFEELLGEAFRSRVCQVWGVDPDDPDRDEVVLEAEGPVLRPHAGALAGAELRAEHEANRFETAEDGTRTAESAWRLVGGGATVPLVHRERWDPRALPVDALPGDRAWAPDPSGGGAIVLSRESGELRHEGGRCTFAGFPALSAEGCDDLQALAAARLLADCR